MSDDIDERLREVAGDWEKTISSSTTIDGGFNPRASVRATAVGEAETEDIKAAIRKLPRIETERDDGKFPALEYRDVLGEGGMGRVWLGLQIPVGREVAVKQIREGNKYGTRDREEELNTLLREAWITGFLEHPNIVPIYRVGSDEKGEPVIVMKRIEGVAWQDVLEDPTSVPVEVDADDMRQWHIETLIQVCHAMEFAHDRGIIHRDLKPENVMLGAFGEVYVVDWGISAAVDAIDSNERIPTISEVTTSVGTPAFMSPEMILADEERIDERSDIYLLGGILHNILTGEPPHDGKTMIQVLVAIKESDGAVFDPDVPTKLGEICRRALAAEPEDRYPSVRALREDLQDYVRHRESMVLSEEAHRRLNVLEERLEAAGAELEAPEDDDELREDFVRCRFGFEQALELSSDNESAREGLQRLLEVMIERELARGGYEAASHFLADLPQRRPGLEERVEKLGRELASKEREYEELQQLQHEADVDVGRHARSLFVLAVGGLTTMLNLTPIVWAGATGEEPPALVPLTAFAVFAIGVGALVYRARRALFQNDANRKMILTVFAVLGGDALYRLLNLEAGAPLPTVASFKAVMLGMCFVVLAISLDLRLLWLAVTFLIVAPLQLAFPGHVLLLAAAGIIAGTGLLAWAWWPED